MSELVYRSDFVVTLVNSWGSDREIAEDALARDPTEPLIDDAKTASVIRAMLARKIVHTSPFEHSGFKVYVEAPAVVWWEWTRHRFMPQSRFDHSFNLESGRYRVLTPHFYLPPRDRPIREPDGFKPMRPNHVHDDELTRSVHIEQQIAHRNAWESYQRQIQSGVAREVARNVLGPAIYYRARVSGGVLSWLHFISLRTRDDAVNPSSYPQWEIEAAALKCEKILASLFPMTYSIFTAKGRVV